MIAGKTLDTWKNDIPLIQEMMAYKELFWKNDKHLSFDKEHFSITNNDIDETEALLIRFAPYLSIVFPETEKNNGLIESPLRQIHSMKKVLNGELEHKISGDLLLKCDSHLPISGSIKARGGIFEVLKYAETLAFENGMLTEDDDYSILASDGFKSFFSNHKLSVGSTGNLGLSIGIMGAKLGFQVTVHMSSDARQWKKDMLRAKGVEVIEYDSDYSLAVTEGRKMAESEENNYFIDDENSINLFLGYAVAGRRVQRQLNEQKITVDESHPLFVYLPCGVGGGPGGVAFGLKMLYGDHVHVFFAEPTHSPCMMLGMLTGKHDQVCVQDFEIDNITCADGLAVGRPSAFIGKTLEHVINGFFTVSDENMFKCLKKMKDSENIFLEPSALAGIASILNFYRNEAFFDYCSSSVVEPKNVMHLAWATGGNMVPKDILNAYYRKGC